MNRPARVRAVRLHPRTLASLALASTVGLLAFGWPFVASPESALVAHAGDAPWLFAALMPIVLVVVLAQMSDGGLDAKGVALLGLLSALVTVLRPLGAGNAGLEPFWFVIIIGGRVLGPGFGFALGSVSLFASALLTGGVGPWLPFQMIAAGWIGMGAGLIPGRGPRWTGTRLEALVLAGYGALAALLFGLAMNAWFWPYYTQMDTAISFQPGAPVSENVARLLVFSAATSFGFDLPRAVVTAVLLAVVGPPVLRAIRRAAARASFQPEVAFHPAAAAPAPAVPGAAAADRGGT